MAEIKWEDGSSMLGYIVVIAMIAVGVIGLLAFMGEIDSYYSPIKNGTVDPAGIASSGLYNQTFNLTSVLVGLGGQTIFLIFLVVFILIFFGIVYIFLKR